MDKEKLLTLLTFYTPEEINKLIEEKSKKPKLIKPFIKVIKR